MDGEFWGEVLAGYGQSIIIFSAAGIVRRTPLKRSPLVRFATFSLVLLPVALLPVLLVGQTPQYPFQNRALTDNERIANLLSLLTLKEKIDLLGNSLNVPRLGIHADGPLTTFVGSDGQWEGLQGVAVDNVWARRAPGEPGGEFGGKAVIPTTQATQPNGLGQTWDPALVERIAAQEAMEARYIFQSFDRGGLIVRAPNADLARDPRWGRSEESYGEDPFLDGTLATAYVRGLQGPDARYWTTVALAKHFMANSNEDNRERDSSDFDVTLMHTYYAKPFQMAIEEGHAGGLMVSFNAWNGVPMTANPLVKSLVIGQWGFDGMIDTDRDAMQNLVTKHHAYPDFPHAVAASIHIGVNNFLDKAYQPAVEAALQQKLLTEADLDTDLHGLLRCLLKLGALDAAGTTNPYTHIRQGSVAVPWETAEAKAVVLRATTESIVLLKNEPAAGQKLLPLDAVKLHSIAVVGPAGTKVYGGGYTGHLPFAITPLEGIQQAAGPGVKESAATEHDAAVALARASDVAIVVLGNDPNCEGLPFGHCSDPSEGREAIDRKSIDLNPVQQKLVEDVFAANPRTIVVMVSAFPFAIDWVQEHVPAILHMAHSSEQEGAALAAVLFGSANPSGHLTVTWPKSLADLPPLMDYNLRDGRTYMWDRKAPLYAFGYGLSYTSFGFSKLHLSTRRLAAGGELTLTARVTNNGSRAGDDVLQVYVQPATADAAQPQLELEAFQRVTVAAHHTSTVELHVPVAQLATWNTTTDSWELKPGEMRVLVGDASNNLPMAQTLTIAP
jgi:beta-glucosidase